MMAWYDNATRAGPLTYRTYDGRRKARFLDILSLFNRINNSQLRISQLVELRRETTQERVAHRQVSGPYDDSTDGTCKARVENERLGLPRKSDPVRTSLKRGKVSSFRGR